MKVSKTEIVNLFVGLGFDSAINWDTNKLDKKLKRLPGLIETLTEEQMEGLAEEQTILLTEILDEITDSGTVTIDEIEEAQPETEAEETEAEETEAEETEAEGTQPVQTKAKPKKAKPKKEKLASIIVSQILAQTKEFKAKDIIMGIGTDTGYTQNSLNSSVSSALAYGVLFSVLNEKEKGFYIHQ